MTSPGPWPRGGGEMGALIRACDWAATPIGPIESWSPTLRMMVPFLLANRFPLLLWWGPEYVSIYNDPYRPILGKKHPSALGLPVRECWSEIWHILQPLIDTPFHGGPATWNEDIGLEINRHGFVEETHFTIAYSPVPDETVASGIGGVLATVHEVTDKIVGDRRVVALRDLGARVGDAKTAEQACEGAARTLSGHSRDIPFVLLYLVDGDGRHARLAGATGVDGADGFGPAVIDLEAPADHGWPLAHAIQTDAMQIVAPLGGRFAAVPAGPWADRPDTAVVLPIPSSRAGHPAGVLVAGVSARLKFDDHYKDFLDLARTQIATAIGHARAYEDEWKRAEALAQLDRAKTAFFSNVSHEFRTPLTLLVGPLEDGLSDSQTALPPVHRERQEIAHRNALRLLRLVNTLLDFSRLEAGRLEATYEPTDLAALTVDLASGFRSAVEKAGLEFNVSCEPIATPVYVDHDLWEKIVFNLLSNAFKFTFAGRIGVELRQRGDRVELSVSDTGIGIAAADLPRLFERFHRVRHARARTDEGTGIGLALVQELVHLHGGTVSVASEEGRGTTFTASIPTGASHLPPERIGRGHSATRAGAGAAPYVEEALRWLPAEGFGDEASRGAGGPDRAVPATAARILVADDNADMRDYLTRILGQSYRVETAVDGRAALDLIRDHPPDLILTDVMMPTLDGFALVNAIRAEEQSRSIPVILLSARAGEEARIEGLRAGADEYLVKPFSARELLACVSSQLQLAALRRESRRASAAQAYLAAIVDSADDAIISKNLNGVIQSCNAAAERLFGYSSSELVGQHVKLLIPPERHWEEDDILARLRRGERIDHFETVRVTKHGRLMDISLTVSPVRDDSGRVIGASKIARDITGIKQAEQERMRLLHENAAVTETLNNVGALVASDLDQAKVVQAVTDAATELTTAEFGAFFYNLVDHDGESYTLYTISGVPRESFSHFPMPRNTEVFEPTFKGMGIVRSPDITKDPRYGHNAPHHGMPPGHLPVCSYLAVPVKGRAGEVIGGLFFGHSQAGRFDAHHERLALGVASWASVALENARLYMNVQETSRIKDDFLASLSHELRTPLNAILGYARMLRSGMVAPERRQKAIDTIERNATALTQIVEDVLDISRIVSGKIRLNVQAVDVPDLVRGAIDAIAPAADAKGLRLETVLDSNAGPISGDPDRLQQILWNLLSNAVKFTNRGGRVQVRLERIDSHVEITVSDTGIGIAPGFLPRVFERFHQADAGIAREHGGLGLGLSIARQLTELHGGTIEAASSGPGQGSTFCLKIPLTILSPGREGERRAHPRRPAAVATISAADLRGVHVLAVDDEVDALSLVSEVLEAAGARVTTASSAQDALSRLDGEVPDVILADLGMPRMDGFAFIDRVRRHPDPRVRSLPSAALTAYARSEDRMKALRAGFQIHLAKPIDPAELVTTLASLAKRFVGRDSEGESA